MTADFRSAGKSHLKRLEDVFGAVLVCLFGRKLRFLELQKLTPKNLQMINVNNKRTKNLFFWHRRSYLICVTLILSDCRTRSSHLNLFVAGGELPLLKNEDVVSDPLQQHGDQLIVLLPTQLQLLKHRCSN